jgi:predicted membrane channel-forming protein YqfA (hemolysin III family)
MFLVLFGWLLAGRKILTDKFKRTGPLFSLMLLWVCWGGVWLHVGLAFYAFDSQRKHMQQL